MYVVSGSEGFALQFSSAEERREVAQQLLDMPDECTVWCLTQDTNNMESVKRFTHMVKGMDKLAPLQTGLQAAYDNAFCIFKWPRVPTVGISLKEHNMSFVDVVIRASCKIFQMSRMPLARDLWINSSLLDIIQSLPGFKPAADNGVECSNREIGWLNCAWNIRCNDEVLPKHTALLVGTGGAVRIAVTGAWNGEA